MKLRLVPTRGKQAKAFIAAWHRHHEPPVGYVFAVGVAAEDTLVGVATVGRPVNRNYDDGLTVEVTRVAVADNTPNACSMLYAACWRSSAARGYLRALTYTRDDESGASLKAAGWNRGIRREAREGWDTPSRPRDNTDYDSVARWIWHIGSWRYDDGRLIPDPRYTLPTRVAAPTDAVEPDQLVLWEAA